MANAQQLLDRLREIVGNTKTYGEQRHSKIVAEAENIPTGWRAEHNHVTDGRVEINASGSDFTVFFWDERNSIVSRLDLPLAAVRCAIARGALNSIACGNDEPEHL